MGDLKKVKSWVYIHFALYAIDLRIFFGVRVGRRNRAVVAELVRASYLIDTLSMLKVEGSNPAISRSFLDVGNGRTRAELIRESISELNSRNLDFRFYDVIRKYDVIERDPVYLAFL